MNFYSFALFFHILCAMGIVAGVCIMFVAAAQLRRATTIGEAQHWLSIARRTNISLGTLAVLILIPAVYMVTVAWNWEDSWIDVAGVGFLIITALCIGPLRVAYSQMEERLAQPSPVSAAMLLDQRFSAVGFWLPMGMLAGDLVGMVYLMTNKPDVIFSGSAIAGGMLLGAVAALWWQRSAARA